MDLTKLKVVNVAINNADLNGFVYEPCGAAGRRKGGAAKIPVIISHGIGSMASFHKDIATSLQQAGFRVLTYNFSGHGFAHRSKGTLTLNRAYSDLCSAIDFMKKRTGAKKVILYGHSLGAIMSAAASARRKDVKALFLLGCPPCLHKSPARSIMFFAMCRIWSRINLRTVWKEFPQFCPARDIKKTKIPIFLFYGRFDQIMFILRQKPKCLYMDKKRMKLQVTPWGGHEPFVRRKYREEIVNWMTENA